jgi:hypothetical protein
MMFDNIINSLVKNLPYNPEKYPMIAAVSNSFKKKSKYYIGFNNTNKCSNLIHSEIKALKNYMDQKIKNENIDICVFRVNNKGELRSSKPCMHCIIYMLKNTDLKIKKIYYSDENGNICCEKLKNININECIITLAHRENYYH